MSEPTEKRVCSCLGHCGGREGLSDRYICALDGRRGKVMTPSTFRAVRQCERLMPASPAPDLSALWGLVEAFEQRAEDATGHKHGGASGLAADELACELRRLGVSRPEGTGTPAQEK